MFDYSYSAWSEIQSDRTEITPLIIGTIPSNNAHNILLLQNSAKFRREKTEKKYCEQHTRK